MTAKEEPQDPSVGSITYWSGNSHKRIRVYSFCPDSALSIIINKTPNFTTFNKNTRKNNSKCLNFSDSRDPPRNNKKRGYLKKKSILSVRSNETFLLVWFSDRDWSWEKQDSSVYGFKFLRIWSLKRNRTKRMARNYACISGFWIRFEIYMTWHGQCQEFIVVDNYRLLIGLGWWISEDKVDS